MLRGAWLYPVLACVLLPSRTVAVIQEPSGRDTTAVALIDRFLTEIYGQPTRVGAVALAVREGEVVLRKAYGRAHVELGVPMTTDHVLAIGSMTKPFTALAVLRLVEDGTIGLDDAITEYLPEYPSGEHPITVRQLLSHTSGIPNYNSLEAWRVRVREEIGVQELTDLFSHQPLDFIPGTDWAYSNSGYHLLGAILARVGGASYEEVLERLVLAPIGATHTTIGSDDEIILGRAAGYEIESDRLRPARPMSLSHLYAGGGLFSTVDDLALLYQALEPGGLLGDDVLREAYSPQALTDGRPTEYSLGWFLGSIEGHQTQYHGGGIYGYVGHMIRVPERDVFFVLLTNCVDPDARPSTQAVAERATAFLLGAGDPTAHRSSIALRPEELSHYVGRYALAPGQERSVILEDGRLFFDQGGGRLVEMIPESRTLFFVEGARGYFTFELGPDGAVAAMVIHTASGREIRADRLPGNP
jgi:D-alanyl-D-alanine carboxypeptidase